MKRELEIKSLVRPGVRALRAYEAKEVPCRVKLDANESPFGFKLSSRLIQTNRYPDPEARALRSALARTMRLGMESVLLGNGSDELISYLITTFGGPVLYPTPTFVMYGIIARALGAKTVEVPLLSEDFDLDADAMFGAIKRNKPRLIFLSTPNNPTSNCFSSDTVLRIIETSGAIVVVDEAYQPFASANGYAPLLADYNNLVILRTLSKIGLAALRVGYLASSPELIAEVNKVRLPFNINTLSQAHALEALSDRKGLKLYISTITSERKRLSAGLAKFKEITVYPSEANFILIKVLEAPALHAALLKQGVLVKNLDNMLKGCLRITVGSRKENEVFLAALGKALAKGGRSNEKSRPKKKN